MNAQRLRPLGIGDIFDEGFDLYKRNFVFLLLATAAVVVPLDILLAFVTPRFLPSLYTLFGVTGSRSDAFWVWTISALARAVFFLPLYIVAVGPAVAAAAARYLNQPMTVEAAFRLSLRKTPALLLAALMTGLLLALGLALCGVVWLVVATQLLFTLQAVLIENMGPGRAMRRSGAVTSGYGFKVFGCLVLLGLVLYVVGLGLRLPLAYVAHSLFSYAPGAGSLSGAGANAQEQVVSLLSSGLAHLLLLPFTICVLTVLYFDLRIRKEGMDIEMLAAELNYPPLSALGPFLPPVPTFGLRPARPAPGPSRIPLPPGGPPR